MKYKEFSSTFNFCWQPYMIECVLFFQYRYYIIIVRMNAKVWLVNWIGEQDRGRVSPRSTNGAIHFM